MTMTPRKHIDECDGQADFCEGTINSELGILLFEASVTPYLIVF